MQIGTPVTYQQAEEDTPFGPYASRTGRQYPALVMADHGDGKLDLVVFSGIGIHTISEVSQGQIYTTTRCWIEIY